ncbi:MAG: lipopolysaccharide biosynthesis protein, partial [Rhizobiaceae bacterium]|nr:lipopolysaccharide biosynthesis protein [Rhizobiaceae bacterium]
LTAIPVRTFTMLLVQRMMRMPHMLKSTWHRVGVESGIFFVSTLAILALGTLLHFVPTILGRNVAEAAPLVIFALFVPGLRNLTEYQAELLFARGQTLVRVINLSLLAGLKAVVLTGILGAASTTETMVVLLNGMFAVLYLASMLLTYAAMRMPAKLA